MPLYLYGAQNIRKESLLLLLLLLLSKPDHFALETLENTPEVKLLA